MKTSILARNGITPQMTELVSRLVDMIPWPVRRQAMGDVTLTLLDGKQRIAEYVFGWGRSNVELGMNEYQSGLLCVNDLSSRQKPKSEVKYPRLVSEIHEIMAPSVQAEPRLRTTLLYTNMTASAVYDALLEKGWSEDALPTVRTISNILNRLDYRLRTVEKTKVQKKTAKRTRSSTTSGE